MNLMCLHVFLVFKRLIYIKFKFNTTVVVVVIVIVNILWCRYCKFQQKKPLKFHLSHIEIREGVGD